MYPGRWWWLARRKAIAYYAFYSTYLYTYVLYMHVPVYTNNNYLADVFQINAAG